MGNFRNGWAVIGPQCVRDLGLVGNVHTHVEKDNHILTGLSGFFPSPRILARHQWHWIGAEADTRKTQSTAHLPFWFNLRHLPVWKSEMIR